MVSRVARPDGPRHHRRGVFAVPAELARADAGSTGQAPSEGERAGDAPAHDARTVAVGCQATGSRRGPVALGPPSAVQGGSADVAVREAGRAGYRSGTRGSQPSG